MNFALIYFLSPQFGDISAIFQLRNFGMNIICYEAIFLNICVGPWNDLGVALRSEKHSYFSMYLTLDVIPYTPRGEGGYTHTWAWPPFLGFSIWFGPYFIPQYNPIDPLFLQKKSVCLYHI